MTEKTVVLIISGTKLSEKVFEAAITQMAKKYHVNFALKKVNSATCFFKIRDADAITGIFPWTRQIMSWSAPPTDGA